MLTRINATNNGSLTSHQVMCRKVNYVLITSYHVQVMAITLINSCTCYYLVTNLVAIMEGADCSLSSSDGSSSELASIESGERTFTFCESQLYTYTRIQHSDVIWCVCIAIHMQLKKDDFKEHCN